MATRIQTQRAKENRRNPTDVEAVMWELLRNRKTGFKIRRQHPIDWFIVDFYCAEALVAIELDGAHHNRDNDEVRDATLWMKGVRVLRFQNERVRQEPDVVVEEIRRVCEARAKLAHQLKAEARIDRDAQSKLNATD